MFSTIFSPGSWHLRLSACIARIHRQSRQLEREFRILGSTKSNHGNGAGIMTTRIVGLVVLCGFLMAGVGVVQAHHAVAGVYDLNKEITLEGRLKKLNFTNPHASIELDVPAKDGSKKITTWVL